MIVTNISRALREEVWVRPYSAYSSITDPHAVDSDKPMGLNWLWNQVGDVVWDVMKEEFTTKVIRWTFET